MANSIILKKSSVTAKVPLASDLAFGEIALNYTDGKIYYKKSDGTTIDYFSSGVSSLPSVAGNSGKFLTNDGTSVSWGSLSSSNITTALGYTPYNSTNPNGYTSNTGTVTSIGLTVPTGLSVLGSPITTSGTLAISLAAGYSIPTTSSQTNWDSAYTQRLQWDGGATNLVVATARTSLGLVIGTNVQAWDADLDAIAALAGTSGFLKKTALNTWTLDTNTYLTAESDTLQTVTTRGASSSVATISLTGNTASTTTGTGTLVVTGGVGISGALNVGGATAIGGDLTVSGNLTVNGTTTTVNSTTITIDDKNIELGSVASPTDVTADGGGITLKGTTDKTFNWVSATNAWTSSVALSAPIHISTVATGTSPLSVTSTTLVTNLNADYLDGNHASAFALSSSIGNGSLGVSIGTAGATNTTVTWGTSSGFTANTASNFTYDLKVGPALTNLAALMTTAGAGFIKRGATADTYTIDTNTYLTANQTITLSGDVTGSGSTSIATTLANSGVTAGTYTKVTVDAKGRVTVGASLASADLPTYTGSITSSQVTTALGFTPYNSTNPSGYITSSGSITGSAYYGFVQDTRSAATGPSLGDKMVRFDFKANATDGLSDGGSYHGVMTFQQWTDASGGGTRQLGFTDNDNLWIRGSGGGITTYGAWKLLLNSSNYTSYVGNGTFTVTAGTGLSGGGTLGTANQSGNSSVTLSLGTSGVTAGTYTLSTITVDAYGRITSASTGTSGLTVTDDVSTNATYYPLIATGTSGSTSAKVSSSKLTYNPSTGTMTAVVFSSSSDESLKTNWRALPTNFLQELAKVKHGIYDRIDEQITQEGVSAQSLQKVLQHSVVKDKDGLLSVNYGAAALVSAIKLAEKVVDQEKRIAKLEALLEKLIGDNK